MNQTPWGNEEKTSEVRKGHRPGGKTLERLESTPPHAPRPPCTGVMMSSRDLPPEKRGEKKQSHAREDFETQRGEKKKKERGRDSGIRGEGKSWTPTLAVTFPPLPFLRGGRLKDKRKVASRIQPHTGLLWIFHQILICKRLLSDSCHNKFVDLIPNSRYVFNELLIAWHDVQLRRSWGIWTHFGLLFF